MELRRFFERAVRASFQDLALDDHPAAEYVADVLTRFARTETLMPRGLEQRRLETVADMLLEVQAVWSEGPHFLPEREVAVRRHIGDYTLFMTGVFPERVQRVASMRFYIDQGKRAYHFVWEHQRANDRREPLPFRRLAERFESFVGAIDYAKRVHFTEFRLAFE